MSTEYVSSDPFSVEPGPDLPINITMHCLVKVDESTAMLIGGFSKSKSLDTVYSFDMSWQSWTPGPALLTSVYKAACGLVKDTVTGYNIVVVAGGQIRFGE